MYNVESWLLMSRSKEREETFILIFESLFNNYDADTILKLAVELRDISLGEGYIDAVFHGVCNNKDELCEIISNNLRGWTLGRISKVALAILLLAVYEIKYCSDIPDSVSINEAVELAKVYGCDNDRSFVNGVLATISKQNAN